MAHHGAPSFREDVQFLVPGDPNEIPFAGLFKGVDGLDEHARIFFGMFERTQKSLFLNAKIVVEGKRVGVFSRDVVRVHKTSSELHTPVNYACELQRGKISYLQSFYDAAATFDFIRQHGVSGPPKSRIPAH
jgi:ketosteroid isomerase-like protein